MPIYEFYCPDCHRIFNFLARSVDTKKRPDCPKCSRPGLDRRVSLFSISKGRKEGEEDMPDIDEARLEQAMEGLAREADGIDENDPRAAGRLMRKLFDATGLQPGKGMEEAMRRMEAGEDPDKVEAEMGDLLEEEAPFSTGGTSLDIRGWRRKVLPPSVDETLYDL